VWYLAEVGDEEMDDGMFGAKQVTAGQRTQAPQINLPVTRERGSMGDSDHSHA